MRIVRFHLEPWQKGGSIPSGHSSPQSSLSSLPMLSDSVLRRQRCPSLDDLSNIDTNLFERRTSTTLSHSSNSRHSTYTKRKLPQMVKRLCVLCSDVLARSVLCFLSQILYLWSDFSPDIFPLTKSIWSQHRFWFISLIFTYTATDIYIGPRRGRAPTTPRFGQQWRRWYDTIRRSTWSISIMESTYTLRCWANLYICWLNFNCGQSIQNDSRLVWHSNGKKVCGKTVGRNATASIRNCSCGPCIIAHTPSRCNFWRKWRR